MSRTEANRTSQFRRWLLFVIASAGISLVVGLPVGGFVFGVIRSEGGNPLPAGLIYAVLTTLYLGFPPKNEGLVGDPFNAWPVIIGSDVVIFVTLVFIFAGLSKANLWNGKLTEPQPSPPGINEVD